MLKKSCFKRALSHIPTPPIPPHHRDEEARSTVETGQQYFFAHVQLVGSTDEAGELFVKGKDTEFPAVSGVDWYMFVYPRPSNLRLP